MINPNIGSNGAQREGDDRHARMIAGNQSIESHASASAVFASRSDGCGTVLR